MNAPERARIRKHLAAIEAIIAADEQRRQLPADVAEQRRQQLANGRRTIDANRAKRTQEQVEARKAELWAELAKLEGEK